MKQAFLKITAAALLAAVTLTGCVGVNFDSYNRGAVTGTGEMVTREYDAPGYTGVRIEGNFVVEYSNAPSDKVSIKIQEDLIPYVIVKMEGDLLVVESEKNFNINQNNKAPVLYLSTATLELLDVRGAIAMDVADTIKAKSFRLDVSGACAVELPLEVEKLDVNIAGASSMELSGTADDANFTIAGASSFEALALQTKNTTVTIAGMGSGSISCSDNLTVQISGMGSLEYRGDPRLNQINSGMGVIERVQ